jgi:hypothetical protein
VSYSRSKIVDQAKSWIGRKESDGSHKEIIDVYNGHKPLARGYKVTYTDAWCATFVSACAIKCGYTEIIPTECSCEQMISLFKKLGVWVENDAYTPSAGDIIFYDWQDNGVGDNAGRSDHVGIVEKISGNTLVIIEGNCSDSVKRRTLKVNGQYIRGYGIPKYTAETSKPVEITKPEEPIVKPAPAPVQNQAKPEVAAPAKKQVKAADPARSRDDSLAGTYRTEANLNMRHGAGTNKKVLKIIPKNTKVRNYGYYTDTANVRWLYVQVTIDNVVYSGFCSSKYLDKI